LLALPLFVAMLALAPFVAIFDKHRRLAQHFVNNVWAKVSTFPYYRVEVSLPPLYRACIANIVDCC
jgi:1-acyl-sn-glycerol-3-phosphate acyltransferase